MSKYLCTFSGKFGDILWSLPTAKYIAEKIVGGSVDFAVMPYYKSLLPLLADQSYIEKAFVIESWLRVHSNHGDQPWQPPNVNQPSGEPYQQQWHLTYKGHPGISAPEMPLIDFTAYQQKIIFSESPIPFLTVRDLEHNLEEVNFPSGSLPQVIAEKRLVTYSFNEQYAEPKKEFFESLWLNTREANLEFLNVSEMGWREAAWCISKSLSYVGCRSACWVLAMGLGQESLTFEPHPSRHKDCHLGKVFGCSYGREIALPFGPPPAVMGETAASMLKAKLEKEKVAQ
jgi:hypothetical protein